jgi:hypothetical protein
MDTIRQRLNVLSTLADWTRADAPGKPVGYYGYNTLTGVPPANRPYAQELARHIDAFFPSMYTFDDSQGAWATRAQSEAAEDRALADILKLLWRTVVVLRPEVEKDRFAGDVCVGSRVRDRAR